jgi:hypothetical protein
LYSEYKRRKKFLFCRKKLKYSTDCIKKYRLAVPGNPWRGLQKQSAPISPFMRKAPEAAA